MAQRLALVGEGERRRLRGEARAIPQAMEWSLATPMIRPRLPCIRCIVRSNSITLTYAFSRIFITCVAYQASTRLSTNEAFVPPKPNEFDSTQPSFTPSRRSRTIGMSAKAGSSCSILALSQMNPLFIIRME